VAWALGYLALAALLQFRIVSIPYDADTAYHVAVGRLIREHGILREFPWTPFSWLADHYADKELLFHLLFVPLAEIDWITAARTVGTLTGAGALLALYLVLRAEGVRFAGVWAALPLLASDVFLFRFALVRPHLLSLALAPIVLWAAARGRLAFLAVASFAYPWAYVAWQLPVVLAGLAELSRLLSREPLRWRTLAVAAGAVAFGVALHPNGLNLVRFNWIVLVEVLFRHAWGGGEVLDLGDEFLPFTPAQWVRWLLASLALAVAAAALAWRARRTGSVPLAFALGALAFGALTLRTARFAEYFVPFSVAAFAVASRTVRWKPLLPAVAAACLAYAGKPALETLEGLGAKEERTPTALAAWLQARIPPGAQVFTCGWGHTGTLMLALPERRFLVALDPTLMYVKDPDLYRRWMRLQREAPPGLAREIRERFGASFVICFWEEWLRAFSDRIAFEPGVRTLLLTEYWNVYDLGGASPGDPVPPGTGSPAPTPAAPR
jgi:hypothetical protein